ncbi:hypothetical protein [Glutamicibacter ardleyensis]
MSNSKFSPKEISEAKAYAEDMAMGHCEKCNTVYHPDGSPDGGHVCES